MISGNAPPSAKVTSDAPWIYIVDDDLSVREALGSLFRSVGYHVHLFGSTDEFLKARLAESSCCLVLDVRLPGVSGLDLQNHLQRESVHIPIIFMTGHGDIPMSVRAMKAGAVDFLPKPFRDQDMLDAVGNALQADRKRREAEQSASIVRAAFDSLSAREREIMQLVTSGLMNKQVAGKLDLSEITVKVHRASVMRKMSAQSLADLVRMAELLNLGRLKA
jgi:FixJ family two-component response regulator